MGIITALKKWWDLISPWEKRGASIPAHPALVERTYEERKSLLTKYVASEVSRGGRVQFHTDHDAVLEFGRRPNHILHFLLCFPTLGFWIPIWILLGLNMNIVNRKYHVDQFGQIEII